MPAGERQSGGSEGRRIEEILTSVSDGALQARLKSVVARALVVHDLLMSIDLKRLEGLQRELAGLEVWAMVAPAFGAVFKAIAEMNAGLRSAFPQGAAPAAKDEEIDILFDVDPGSLAAGAYQRRDDRLGEEIDRLVRKVAGSEQRDPTSEAMASLGQTVWTIAAMMQEEMRRFGTRLRQVAVVTDRWNLLAEMQETRHKLGKAAAAVIIAVCSSFARVRPEEIVPGFRTELALSLGLRAGMFALRDEVRAVRAGIDKQPAHGWISGARRVGALLETFLQEPAFGWMRALDKRALVDAHDALGQALAARDTPRRLAELIEGIVRFLEALEAINRREILVEHDRRAFASAASKLEESLNDTGQPGRLAFGAALAELAAAAGRDPQIDSMVERSLDPAASADPRGLLERVRAVMGYF
jgi:hypothetical protein